jgi:hypothetical protein
MGHTRLHGTLHTQIIKLRKILNGDHDRWYGREGGMIWSTASERVPNHLSFSVEREKREAEGQRRSDCRSAQTPLASQEYFV